MQIGTRRREGKLCMIQQKGERAVGSGSTVRPGEQAMEYVARNTLFLGKYSEKIETGGD